MSKPKHCKITVTYLNGDTEEYFGGLHADDKLLRIYPKGSRKTVSIPLVCIKRYETEEEGSVCQK